MVIVYEWHDAIGNLGVFLVLLAYGLLQTDRIDPRGWRYSVANAIGSACICVSLSQDFNLSSLIIEGCWVLISLYGIYRWWVGRIA